MIKINQKGSTDLAELAGITLTIGIFLLILGIIALLFLWTDSNLDWMMSEIKGQAVNVPYWLSFLITLIFNGFALMFNIIVSLIRLVH